MTLEGLFYEGESMDPDLCADYGKQAARAGSCEPDDLDNKELLVDALTNLMHWAKRESVDFEWAAGQAEMHFDAEQGMALRGKRKEKACE